MVCVCVFAFDWALRLLARALGSGLQGLPWDGEARGGQQGLWWVLGLLGGDQVLGQVQDSWQKSRAGLQA